MYCIIKATWEARTVGLREVERHLCLHNEKVKLLWREEAKMHAATKEARVRASARDLQHSQTLLGFFTAHRGLGFILFYYLYGITVWSAVPQTTLCAEAPFENTVIVQNVFKPYVEEGLN